MSGHTLRRHHRISYNGPVRLAWRDYDGLDRYALGKCIDISESGMLIEVSETIPVRTHVSAHLERLQLHASAFVKHITRKGLRQVLGLEFSETFKHPILELQEQVV